MDAKELTDEQIDFIANDGCRNAAGGIYATRVYEFARAIECAVLVALTSGAAQALQGWKLVPIEPTYEMLDRGHHQIDFDRNNQNTLALFHESHQGENGSGTTIEQDMRDAWGAMLEASPTPPVAAALSDMKEGRWCPDECPITGLEFFMWMEHPELGYVPTYGGPFDSYTLAMPDEDGLLHAERYDHDRGEWIEGGAPMEARDELIAAAEVDEPAAAQPDERAAFDMEAMLKACVPGGSICDPQIIADSLREWFAASATAPQAGATLTTKQRSALRYAILAIKSNPRWVGYQVDELEALLASVPTEQRVSDAEPRPKVALTADDADMVWHAEDGETFFHTIDDAVDYEIDQAWPTTGPLELKLSLGKSIPAATVRIFNITENGHEWEFIDAARKGASE